MKTTFTSEDEKDEYCDICGKQLYDGRTCECWLWDIGKGISADKAYNNDLAVTSSIKLAFKRIRHYREMENKVIRLAKIGNQEALNYLQRFYRLKQFTESEIVKLRPGFFTQHNKIKG